MHIVARGAVYGEENPLENWRDDDPGSDALEMMGAVYRDRMRSDLWDWNELHWFPETSEIGSEDGTTLEQDEIEAHFLDAAERIASEIMSMSPDELRAAYDSI